MFKNILAIACLLLTLVACKSGPSPDEGKEVAPGITEPPPGGFDGGSDTGNIPGLFSINFEYDRATLSADAKEKLAKNAEWMKTNSSNLQIEGHCDSRGSIEYNLTLGERRANSVKTYLVGLGIKAERLSILSYGEEKPLDGSDSEVAHATNRRANFVPTN